MGAPKKKTASKSSEYAIQRRRNNAAVSKSRQKKRDITEQTRETVEQLRSENQRLEVELENLQKQVDTMKELFVQLNADPKPSAKRNSNVKRLVDLFKRQRESGSSSTLELDEQLLDILQRI